MKKPIPVLLIVFIFFASPIAFAGDHRTFGLGIVLIEPTGLSAKWFLSPQNALDFDLAYSLGRHFWFSTDYLWHFSDALPNQPVVIMRPYLGGGGVLAGRNHPDPPKDKKDDRDEVVGVAARFTGGLSFLFTKVPIELLVDVSPGIWLVPSTDFMLNGVIGVRYFF